MNKPLLLCLLVALWGQAFAQKSPFKSYKAAQSVEFNTLSIPAPGFQNIKKTVPALSGTQPDRVVNTNPPGKTEFPEYWPDRIFLKLKNGAVKGQLTFDHKAKRVKSGRNEKLNKAFQRHQITKFSTLPLTSKASAAADVYELVMDQSGQMPLLMQELKAIPEVAYVERVPYYVALGSPNDPAYVENNQYALVKTKAAEAYGIHTGSVKTLLAIVDDAVLVSHPDLASNINTAKSYDVADNDSDPRPPASGPNKAGTGSFSHGTHCAGIAGAVTDNGTGVAAISNNKVSIIGVKCTRDLAPNARVIEYAAEGMIYAINQGARVISMSFGGGGYSQTIQNIINEATANGVVFVAAAGNDNTESRMYPAAYDNVIAVASTDANDLKSSFSNYGAWVDIAAPGSGILSTVTAADGLGGAYTYYNGTSMACPMVASLVAYMLSENPNLTPQAVTQLLKNTADPLDNIPNQSPALAGKLGAGRINAYRAIQGVKGIAQAVTPAAITDLRASRTGQTDVQIQWSAPDAGGQPAALYDIRYSTAPITTSNFQAATKTKESIFPAEPGVSQSLVVKGLVPGTTYYFAILAKSFYGSSSPLSNVAQAATQAAPIITVNASANNLTLNRANGNTTSASFSISNTGAADLNYETTLVPLAGHNILSYDKPQQIADNSVGLGGDSFVSAAKFVAGPGGFNLTHVQNYLSSSFTTGKVSLGIRILKGGTNPAQATLLTSQTATAVIPAGGSLFTFPLQQPQQFAPGEVFWIAFVLPVGVDYPQGFDEVGANPNTFFLSLDNGSSYEDAQTLDYFLAHATFKIRAVNADWVTLSPATGTVLPGQTSQVGMAFNGIKLQDGFYQMQVTFGSNDPTKPLITKPIDLTVTGGQPIFWMEPAEVDFGTLFVGTSRTLKVVVGNKGTATLEVNPEDLNLEPYATDDFDINVREVNPFLPGTQQEALVTFTPSKLGELNGTATLSSNDPNAPVITVPVKASVIAPPVAEVTPTSLNFEMDFSGTHTATQEVHIKNKGEAELDYTLQALVEPLAQIGYSANRPPDNYLGFGEQYPYLQTALKFNVTTPSFNLTHVQNFLKTEVAGNKSITLKVYKGGNAPTSGTLLLQQSFAVPADAASGSLATFPLQQPQLFKQGEVFWLVFDLTGFSQPQGYHTNTPQAGHNFFSSNGVNWYALESAGGIYTSSTFMIKALDMPQWLTVTSGNTLSTPAETFKVATGSQRQNLVRVNLAGLPKGRYQGKIQVNTNDPKKPLTTIDVQVHLEEFPVAAFTAPITEVLPGEEVTFLNLSKNADAYEWNFAGAAPVSSTLASPTVKYNAPGKYKVSLVAKNTRTGRTSETLVKEEYIMVTNTSCQELNSPFADNASLATTNEGFITGNNKKEDLAKVNYFNYNRPHGYLTGVKVKFGAAAAADLEAKVKIAVLDKGADGRPGNIIAAEEIKITDIIADVNAGRVTEIKLDAPVQLPGSFYAGVILNNEPGNAVAIFHNAPAEPTPGLGWSQDREQNWQPFGAVWPNMAGMALYIQPSIIQTLTPIQANFTLSSEMVCAGEQLTLDASATMGAVRYEWLLPGASTPSSTEIKPGLSYSRPGTYKIILKAYDACSGVMVVTKTITVKSLPDAAVTASGATTLCAGNKVTLSAAGGEGYTYRWSNGATSRSIEVSTTGDYSVTVTNAAGCQVISAAIPVKVNPLPLTTIIPEGPTTFCAGESVTLTASEGKGYLWSNGATTRQITVHTSGEYQVVVTNAAGCQSASAITKVVVNPLPVATIEPGGSTQICQGESVTLAAPEGDGYVYRWSNGATTRVISVKASDTYRVTITNANGCAVTSEAVNVAVNPLPVATITAGGPTTLCQGERVTLTASEGKSYRWSNGATTRSIEVGMAGKYAVTVINAQGCSATSKPVEVKVNGLPIAAITPSGPTTFCQGNQVVLTASEGSSYLWSNGATTRSITVSESGKFSVQVLNHNGCAATSATVITQLNLLPHKPVISRKDVVLSSSAVYGNQWFRNNSAIPGATGTVYDATEPGVYQVRVTNGNGCVSEISNEITVTKEDLLMDITVYPNPGDGHFVLNFTGLKPDKISIRIYNAQGKLIYENLKSLLNSRTHPVDISKVAAGIYILQVEQNNRRYNRRIVVQH